MGAVRDDRILINPHNIRFVTFEANGAVSRKELPGGGYTEDRYTVFRIRIFSKGSPHGQIVDYGRDEAAARKMFDAICSETKAKDVR